ncbi:alpha-L-fucosidase [Flavitalea flava]
MRKILLLVALSFYASTFLCGQTDTASHDERMKWWREARFGMFIHWGVYAQLAGVYQGHEQARGGAEWIMNRMKIPVAEYQAYAKAFNPVKFDADQWVRAAKNAGMKYIVITAKHHDGFALFQSAASPWNIVDATPYGKDILKQLAAACKRQGMKLGFYYSHAQDWNNPGGSAARKPMREGWPNPESAKIDAYTESHNGHWDPAQETADFNQYIDRVSVPQVRELLSNYGDVAVLWWDTPTNMTDYAALKLQALLKLQPAIITNDRLKRPNFQGDTRSPEQKIPGLNELDGKDWETCMTMNGTWGYRTTDNKWKSPETLIRNLVDISSKGGNYLLNVGPKPDGTFPEQTVQILKEIGAWMKINGEAIYATGASPLGPLSWGRCTKKDTKDGTILYLSVFDLPATGKLIVPGLKKEVKSATILDGGKKLKTGTAGGGPKGDHGGDLIIELPAIPETSAAKMVTVIKLVLD